MDITLIWYLVPALVMFCCGVYGFLTRRNMIAMLISLELMLNAVDINFVVFNRYLFPLRWKDGCLPFSASLSPLPRPRSQSR